MQHLRWVADTGENVIASTVVSMGFPAMVCNGTISTAELPGSTETREGGVAGSRLLLGYCACLLQISITRCCCSDCSVVPVQQGNLVGLVQECTAGPNVFDMLQVYLMASLRAVEVAL